MEVLLALFLGVSLGMNIHVFTTPTTTYANSLERLCAENPDNEEC